MLYLVLPYGVARGKGSHTQAYTEMATQIYLVRLVMVHSGMNFLTSSHGSHSPLPVLTMFSLPAFGLKTRSRLVKCRTEPPSGFNRARHEDHRRLKSRKSKPEAETDYGLKIICRRQF